MGSLGTAELRDAAEEVSKEQGCPRMDVGLIQRKSVGALRNCTGDSPKLFTPLTIRGVTFQNRIFVSLSFAKFPLHDAHLSFAAVDILNLICI